MSEIHVERLRTLYAMMAGIPPELINLEEWRFSTLYGVRTLFHGVSDGDLLSQNCGTVACAVGWACAYPDFINQGLGWDDNPFFVDRSAIHYGWDAVRGFFGLDEEQAEYLFSDRELKRPDMGLHRERVPVRSISADGEKMVILERIRYHLLETGAITTARFDELALQEIAGKLTP